MNVQNVTRGYSTRYAPMIPEIAPDAPVSR